MEAGEHLKKFVLEQVQKQSKIGTQIQFAHTTYQKGLIRDALSRVNLDPDDSTQARLILFNMRKGSVSKAVFTEFDDLEAQILKYIDQKSDNAANPNQKDREL